MQLYFLINLPFYTPSIPYLVNTTVLGPTPRKVQFLADGEVNKINLLNRLIINWLTMSDWGNYSHQVHRCPRDWRLSASWGPEVPLWNPYLLEASRSLLFYVTKISVFWRKMVIFWKNIDSTKEKMNFISLHITLSLYAGVNNRVNNNCLLECLITSQLLIYKLKNIDRN